MTDSPKLPSNYAELLDRLLTLGRPKRQVIDFDYAACGITPEHIPGLIRMLSDDRLNNAPVDSNLVWGPLYAWRALGALKAEAAIGPLLDLLARIGSHHDDWVSEDGPQVLGEIGPAAVGPTVVYLADEGHDEWARVAAAKALEELGKRNPELREPCLNALRKQLARQAEQSESLNAFLILSLLDFKAVEALPEIREACDADHVDESVSGDFEDFEIELGLKMARTKPARPNKLSELGAQMRAALGDALPGGDDVDDALADARPRSPAKSVKIGRNDPCPCGSGKKYKKCCGKN